MREQAYGSSVEPALCKTKGLKCWDMCVDKDKSFKACQRVKSYLMRKDSSGYYEKLRDFPGRDLAHLLQSGIRKCVFTRQEMGVDAQYWRAWQEERLFQVALYKRQTACPSDFARMYLSVEVCDSEHFELAIAPALKEDTSISLPGLAPDARENVFLISGWLLGFIEGLRAHQFWGLRITVHNIWVHLIDSQPRSYYHCAYHFIRELSRE